MWCVQDDRGGDYRYAVQPDMDKQVKKDKKKSKKERKSELEDLKKEIDMVSAS